MNASESAYDQAMLADSARTYVARGYGDAVRAASVASPHGCAPERWREFADMGWLALSIPEEDGGLGGSVDDICVLAEELGRGLIVEPWNSCAVMAAALLAATADPRQRAHWLPALAAGAKRVSFAAWETGGRGDATHITTRAERVDGGFRLDGAKELALGAPGADALIVGALLTEAGDAPRAALFLLEPGGAGLGIQAYAMIDGRQAAQLQLRGLVVPATARLDTAPDVTLAIRLAIDRAALVSCAEATGAMAKALEITIDYLKTRKQFGRILAANQALQHRLVDLHVAVAESRALVRAVAQAFDGPELQRQAAVAASKAYASQAARLMWEETVQMHGAIGMTDEYPLSQYVKFLTASHMLYGDAELHLERLAQIEERLHAPA